MVSRVEAWKPASAKCLNNLRMEFSGNSRCICRNAAIFLTRKLRHDSLILEAGYDVRKIQILMGHRSLSTTMVYLHVSRRGLEMVKSPLDFVDEEKEITSPWEDTDDTISV